MEEKDRKSYNKHKNKNNKNKQKTCYKCGMKNHISTECRASQWKIDKFEEEKKNNNNKNSNNSKTNKSQSQTKEQTSNVELAMNISCSDK